MTVSAAGSQKQRGQTAYRVLKITVPTGQDSASLQSGIENVGSVKAANAQAAIRAVGEKHGNGTYVAVPESSWKPQKVTVEQTTVVKVGEPG